MSKNTRTGALMGIAALSLITLAALPRAPLVYWLPGIALLAGALFVTRKM